jgi:hypothetical protein
LTFCAFCGTKATVGVQVDPRDPKDVRPACGACGEKIKALSGGYRIVGVEKARAVVVEDDDEGGDDDGDA